jgi:hypothetical protein
MSQNLSPLSETQENTKPFKVYFFPTKTDETGAVLSPALAQGTAYKNTREKE